MITLDAGREGDGVCRRGMVAEDGPRLDEGLMISAWDDRAGDAVREGPSDPSSLITV